MAAGISDGSIETQSATTYSIGAASLVQVRFQLECLLGRLCLWSLEPLFLVLVIPAIVVAARPKVGDRPHHAHCASPKRKYVSNPDLHYTYVAVA